jgi:predicted outer membrane protein
MRTITAAIAVALLATVVGTSAGPVAAQASGAQADQPFVFSVLQEARGQVAFARFAQPRAQTIAVQRLAASTLDEWSELAGRLESVASANGEVAPSTLTAAQERIFAELRRTHAEDFDAAYVRIAETDYERVLEAFQGAGGLADPEIAATIDAVRPDFERLGRQTTEDPALPGTF